MTEFHFLIKFDQEGQLLTLSAHGTFFKSSFLDPPVNLGIRSSWNNLRMGTRPQPEDRLAKCSEQQRVGGLQTLYSSFAKKAQKTFSPGLHDSSAPFESSSTFLMESLDILTLLGIVLK